MSSNGMLRKIFCCCVALLLSNVVWADDFRLPTDVEQNSSNGFEAYVLSELVWSALPQVWSKDGYINVPTCWTKSKGMYPRQKEIVRRAIATTWEINTLVRFTGWGDCDDTKPFNPNLFNGIRIATTDPAKPEVPYSYLGVFANRQKVSMVLNLEPGKTAPNYFGGCGKPNNPSDDECAEWIAVHEFGHVLGLSHEQERADTPNSCPDKEKPENRYGDIGIGNWDLFSIMNYCNPKWNNDGQLTPMDRLAAKAFYDRLATADLGTRWVNIPVVTYMGASYRLLLQANATLSEFKAVGAAPTNDLSASPATFDGTTLSVPFIGVMVNGVVNKALAVEGVVFTYNPQRAAFVLTDTSSSY